MRRGHIGVLIGCVAGVGLFSPVTQAQELSVSGNSSSANVFEATNTSTDASNRVAVSGTSTPAVGSGIGGSFTGGSIGVKGHVTSLATTPQYGGYFLAQGGTSNFGIYARTLGPGWAGYFVGNVYVSGTVTQSSDLKLKKDVRDMPEGTLTNVLRLRPKTYRYDSSIEPGLGLPADDQVGFVAQDVAEVFPALVKKVTVPSSDTTKSDDTVLSVDYVKVVPLLVKAIQEQQEEIRSLQSQVGKLRATKSSRR